MLIDFGLARETSTVGLTTVGRFLGTPEYSSPKQVRGESDLTPAADLYACGITLWEMLAGKPPFTETQTAAVLMAHLNQPPLPITTPLPDTLLATVARCLAKDRDERFADCQELAWWHTGFCLEGEGSVCGGVLGVLCPSDELTCIYEQNVPDGQGVCVQLGSCQEPLDCEYQNLNHEECEGDWTCPDHVCTWECG